MNEFVENIYNELTNVWENCTKPITNDIDSSAKNFGELLVNRVAGNGLVHHDSRYKGVDENGKAITETVSVCYIRDIELEDDTITVDLSYWQKYGQFVVHKKEGSAGWNKRIPNAGTSIQFEVNIDGDETDADIIVNVFYNGYAGCANIKCIDGRVIVFDENGEEYDYTSLVFNASDSFSTDRGLSKQMQSVIADQIVWICETIYNVMFEMTGCTQLE